MLVVQLLVAYSTINEALPEVWELCTVHLKPKAGLDELNKLAEVLEIRLG
jgi:hypothetical protein